MTPKQHYNFTKLLNDTDYEDLMEMKIMLDREIRLSEKAQEEGFEQL